MTTSFTSYSDLLAMPDHDLLEAFDRAASSTYFGLGFIRDELHRRQEDRRGRRMERLTWTNVFLTAANIGLVAYTVLR